MRECPDMAKSRKKLLAGLIVFVLSFGTVLGASFDSEKYEYYKSQFAEQILEGHGRLANTKQRLDEEYEIFLDSLDSSKKIEEKLVQVREKIKELNQQLENINLLLSETEKKVISISNQIEQKKLDLTEIYEQIEQITAEAEVQREVVLGYFRLLQQENSTIGDDEVKNTMRLLLADSSFSTHLKNEMYLSTWEEVERKVFHSLEVALAESEEAKKLATKEKNRLEGLNNMLNREKENLSIQKTAKANLLDITSGKQAEYQQYWENSLKQMSSSSRAIENLRDDLDIIETKLEVLQDAREDILLNEGNGNYFDIGEKFLIEDEEAPFSWPVNPSGGITAYYHDPSYEEVFDMVHEAIDIRCAQGMPVKAPALGFVYKTVDNGLGYSYIILAHRNNLTTVYGHMSDIKVKEGDMVQEGDVIGFSGGTPGTKGAGVITTGPHLHFEVFEDGNHKNPLEYLPLDKLPAEYIPTKFLN